MNKQNVVYTHMEHYSAIKMNEVLTHAVMWVTTLSVRKQTKEAPGLYAAIHTKYSEQVNP